MNATVNDKEREKALLQRVRHAADRLKGDRWLIEEQNGEIIIIAARSTGEDVHICTIHADALLAERDVLAGALEHMTLFLRLFDRAAAAVRDLQGRLGRQEAEARKKDYAAQASMLLSDARFQAFLSGKGAGGPVRDKQAADTRLKFILNIASKADLNGERGAALWRGLMGEFDSFKRGSR